MKYRILATALFVTLAAAACTCAAPTATEKQNVSPALDTGFLLAYHWVLTDAKNVNGEKIDGLFVREDHPVQLDFTETQMMVSNTCNTMSGAYTVEENKITLTPLRSTLKRCVDENLNQLDQEVGRRLTGEISFAFTPAKTPENLPVLRLTLSSNDTLFFFGHPTPETRYGSKGEIIFLEVADKTRPCAHPLIPALECIQVRRVYYDENGIKTGDSGEFESFSTSIEGYTHTPGVRNILRVKRYPLSHPPADAADAAYVLDMVVKSETVTP
ncbi:META and DUF4377 domain-containing protein [Desulfosarcina sp. OttesenSCG-928-A07]|nr:META and DUF4377 domain-containing protein [Desulfosarcina sp. OttesenSCG-928-G17]MDL2328386.1 META and DUF4377 domain-containing protein [Desulfosarcina sp. OttesenSCG-928-A07]